MKSVTAIALLAWTVSFGGGPVFAQNPAGGVPATSPHDPTPEDTPEDNPAKGEVERARREVDKARLDAEQARRDAERARLEAARLRWEAENARKNDTRNIQKNNNISVNPLGLLIGGISLGYTGGFADLMSISLRASYLPPLLFDFHTVGGELSLHFWPRHPNNGFFVGPLVQISKTISTEENFIGILGVAPGASLGWRWIWNNGLNLGLGAGFAWVFPAAKDKWTCPSGYVCEEKISGDGPRLLLILDFGYAFSLGDPSSS